MDTQPGDVLDLTGFDRFWVYRIWDSAGRLLYVGFTAQHPLVRIAQHRTVAPWRDEIAEVRVVEYPTEAAALVAEGQAIASEAPLYNTSGVPSRPRAARPRKRRPSKIVTLDADALNELAESHTWLRQVTTYAG